MLYTHTHTRTHPQNRYLKADALEWCTTNQDEITIVVSYGIRLWWMEGCTFTLVDSRQVLLANVVLYICTGFTYYGFMFLLYDSFGHIMGFVRVIEVAVDRLLITILMKMYQRICWWIDELSCWRWTKTQIDTLIDTQKHTSKYLPILSHT